MMTILLFYFLWCNLSAIVVGCEMADRKITGRAFIPYLLILVLVNALIGIVAKLLIG